MITQCQCCASPLGEKITWRKTQRNVCNGCLGFIARWIAEVNEGAPVVALPEPPPSPARGEGRGGGL